MKLKLSISTKFNLVFVTIFAVGFIAAGLVSHLLLQASAREETLQSGRMLIETARASRSYTAAQIRPLLETRLKYQFHPQAVPTYAAIEQLNTLLKAYPAFGYKEATLNPTNLRNKASDWEAKVVNQLRADPSLPEILGQRDSAKGPTLFIARPIRITDAACLACHTTPELAPQTMVDIYGREHGFGWKFNEIVGAQIISVPVSLPLARADGIWRTFMLSLLVVFVLLLVALNMMVHFFVTRRITRLDALTRQVSLGHDDVAPFEVSGNDELAALAQSFGRMRTSLDSALKMLEE